MAPDQEEGEGAEDERSAPEIPNAADELEIKAVQQDQQRKKEQAADFWRDALRREAGRKAIWDILDGAGTFTTTFSSGPVGFPDERATWFHAGQRDIGERLFNALVILDRENAFRLLDEHDPRFPKPKRPRRKKSEV